MKRYKVNFVDIMDFIIWNIGVKIPLFFIFVFLIFNCIEMNFDISSLILNLILLSTLIVGTYALFKIKDINKNDLKTIIINENDVTIITRDKTKHIIQKTDITKFQVNISLLTDWTINQYYTDYSLEIRINDNLKFTFYTITFGSIKKFLKIAKYIPNCTFTTSSNFVPYDIMQNILKTGKAVNPILTSYYGLINFLKNPPLIAIISLLIGLIILIYLFFAIFSL